MSFTKSTSNMKIISGITGSADNNYGLTEQQMKAKFDQAAGTLQEDVNRLITELGGSGAADNIGYSNGNYTTIAQALDGIIAAGAGSIPPDLSITNAKLALNAVSEHKLTTNLYNAIYNPKIKLVKLDLSNPTSATSNSITSNYITEDRNLYFDLGFKPSAAFIFGLEEVRAYYSTTTRIFNNYQITTSQHYTREASTYDDDHYIDFGGICFANSQCMSKYKDDLYCFKIESGRTGVTLHSYKFINTDGNGDLIRLVFANDSNSSAQFKGDIYCLAIA